MFVTELDTFVLKFKQLWNSGQTAHINLDTHAGNAWVSLHLQLGFAPGPLLPQPHQAKKIANQSRQRRRERRAAAARQAAAEKAAQEIVQNKTKDSESEMEMDSPVNGDVVIDGTEIFYVEQHRDAKDETLDMSANGDILENCDEDSVIYQIEVFKDRSKESIEAQDAVNFVEESLKKSYEKNEVVASDQVYKFLDVKKANEGFIVKFKIKKSPVMRWFDLCFDFTLIEGTIFYQVQKLQG